MPETVNQYTSIVDTDYTVRFTYVSGLRHPYIQVEIRHRGACVWHDAIDFANEQARAMRPRGWSAAVCNDYADSLVVLRRAGWLQ